MHIEMFSAIDFTHSLLMNAIKERASDIHLEPQSKDFRIRFRLDGVLYETQKLTRYEGQSVINHLKILAQLDIAEHRMPQDGHFSFEADPYKECRLSSCPSIYGEKLVIRLLENASNLVGLEHLGFEPKALDQFRQALNKPQGLILVTGPTGSGKTLTLYHALSLLNQSTRHIISIEDPVEIKLPGITQVNVHHKIGLDFAHALRSFLRQDPDVIMVGEIRDLETAEMVIKAAQTGHLVLSTLHTNNAIASIARLINIGIAPYTIADTLKLVVAQRLLRKLCLSCQGLSCDECKEGYQGRIGAYEVLEIKADLKEAISHKKPLEDIAFQQGFHSLEQAARLKLQQGITNQEEILRVIHS